MAYKFIGTFDQLKDKLKSKFDPASWIELSDNHKQYKYFNGAILNWYPTTGSLNIQGKPESAKQIDPIIRSLLEGKEIKETEDIKTDEADIIQPKPKDILGQKYIDSELVFGIVSSVGTEYSNVVSYLQERLEIHNYYVEIIKVSKDVITQIKSPSGNLLSEYERINKFMDLGNEIRLEKKDNSILALGVASEIFKKREKDEYEGVKPKKRTAYIIISLKHPEEVEILREIYADGFYLIGIASDDKRRLRYLKDEKRMSTEEAHKIITRDQDEIVGYGQHTRDTFQLADYFLSIDNNIDKLKSSIRRILDLIFGHPHITPTFDEFAMFMAFASALRSADLSRQVGAVIAKDNEIIATGANDCPRAGGGLYWHSFCETTNDFIDEPDGRDYKRGEDSNKIEQCKIINDIISNIDGNINKELIRSALENSKIKDITEYGRVVHAEMEALLFCARNNISTRSATLYCTTFPCHNCAKHIIAAGVTKVIYVEPYPKSKAFEFHSDAISQENIGSTNSVSFMPFVGVGPRKFFDLFSMTLSSGYRIKRKHKDGAAVEWTPENSIVRLQMKPYSYLDKETYATCKFDEYRGEL